MSKVSLKIWMKYVAFIGMAITAMKVQAGESTGSQMSDTATRLLAEKPSKPSEARSKYNLSLTETFLKSKNHFSKLEGKSTGNMKTLSLSVVESNKWEWGVDYSHSVSKWQGVENDRVEYSDSHEAIPYGVYFFTPDAYVRMMGGGTYSYVKVRQNAGKPASGSNTSGAGILGIDVGIEKEFGIWRPSASIDVLYENERVSQYTLSDGSFSRKEWSHHLRGSVDAQLNVNIHENFQPYVKAGGKTILRRSKNYTIQKWNGWSLGGGVNLFGGEKWSTALDYGYDYSPKGTRESSLMLKVAVSF